MRFLIRGVALEPHAETIGATNIEKKWPADEIESAAETLIGQPVTRNSTQSAENVIGEVTDVEWDDEEGLRYEAEIRDEEVAEKLRSGLADIAPRMYHEAVGTAEIDESEEPAVVTDLQFDALFMCPEAAEGVPGVTEVTEENDD